MLSINTGALFGHLQEQHVDEAALLWGQRAYGLKQANTTISAITKLETRIENHLTSIHSHTSVAWPFVERNVQDGDASDMFVMSVLALNNPDATKLNIVEDTIQQDISFLSGLASAIGWISNSDFERLMIPTMRRWKRSGNWFYQHLFLTACSVRRLAPQVNFSSMKDTPDSTGEAAMFACAARLVGEMKILDAKQKLLIWLHCEHEALKFWSAWSLAILGESRAIPVLLSFSQSSNLYQYKAINLLMRRMHLPAAQDLVRTLACNNEMPQAILAVASLGLVDSVDWLLDHMSEPAYCHLAGHAFSTITGIDLIGEELHLREEVNSDDLPDEDFMPLEGYEQLARPNPDAIIKRWTVVKGRFTKEQRYLCGYPIPSAPLRMILSKGLQGHRRAAAVELACSERSSRFPNVKMRTACYGGLV